MQLCPSTLLTTPLLRRNEPDLITNNENATMIGGAQAMIQGAATYAAFTYFLDKFFASPSTQQTKSAELMYKDVPIHD
jgi:hypothetical protein|eukprot:scaffold1593_cov193-Alexandrium_tamarense.AAC.84